MVILPLPSPPPPYPPRIQELSTPGLPRHGHAALAVWQGYRETFVKDGGGPEILKRFGTAVTVIEHPKRCLFGWDLMTTNSKGELSICWSMRLVSSIMKSLQFVSRAGVS
eukprot:759190-Hanusia_phi.AAC.2